MPQAPQDRDPAKLFEKILETLPNGQSLIYAIIAGVSLIAVSLASDLHIQTQIAGSHLQSANKSTLRALPVDLGR